MIAKITEDGPALTSEQALGLAIFALNTLLDPSASDDADLAVLDARSEEAIAILDTMRSRYRTVADIAAEREANDPG